jgi:hypothetical protein
VEGYPVTVSFSASGKKPAHTLEFRVGDDDVTTADRFAPAAPGAAELQAYVGMFYSRELDVMWPIVIDAGHLAVRSEARKFVTKTEPIAPAMTDAFSGAPGFLRFMRDATGKVTGFDLSSSRMRGIRFELRQPL